MPLRISSVIPRVCTKPAVMDVTESQPDGDEITEKYWETQRELLNDFLKQLYDDVISGWK